MKRSGRSEVVNRDKVVQRLRALAGGLDINVVALAAKGEEQLHDGVQTAVLDDLAARHEEGQGVGGVREAVELVLHLPDVRERLARHDELVLAVERDAFPECERLGNYMQELSMARNNGLVIAENQPPPGTPPGAFPAPLAEPQGFCLFSRTAEAGVIMKIAVAAAFRGRGVGTALLR